MIEAALHPAKKLSWRAAAEHGIQTSRARAPLASCANRDERIEPVQSPLAVLLHVAAGPPDLGHIRFRLGYIDVVVLMYAVQDSFLELRPRDQLFEPGSARFAFAHVFPEARVSPHQVRQDLRLELVAVVDRCCE